MKKTVRVRRIESRNQLTKAYGIRARVFVKEQGVAKEIELDQDDNRAVHFLAITAGKAVGTARVVLHHDKAKIGRMAVLKSFRRRGIGTKLLNRAVAFAKSHGAGQIYLHAQVQAITFYEALGFQCVGQAFKEARILHRKMRLTN